MFMTLTCLSALAYSIGGYFMKFSLGVLFLNERSSATKLAGISLVVAGIVLLRTSKSNQEQ